MMQQQDDRHRNLDSTPRIDVSFLVGGIILLPLIWFLVQGVVQARLSTPLRLPVPTEWMILAAQSLAVAVLGYFLLRHQHYVRFLMRIFPRLHEGALLLLFYGLSQFLFAVAEVVTPVLSDAHGKIEGMYPAFLVGGFAALALQHFLIPTHRRNEPGEDRAANQ